MNALHVVVDGGVDDALALGVLLGLGVPVGQVVATEGSLCLQTTAAQTAKLMATLGSTVPVTVGADRALLSQYPCGRDPFHGEDCFAGEGAILASVSVPTAPWEPLIGPVLATGALTVVAEALRNGDNVESVVWMGGAVSCGGNMTAAAEFNAWMDPTAADEVLTADLAVSMVPLDVTLRCAWTTREVDALGRSSEAGDLLAKAVAAMVARHGTFVPHDAVAAIALTNPELFGWANRNVRCEASGHVTTGCTVVDRREGGPPGPVSVAEDVSSEAVTKRIIEAIGSLTK